MSTTLEKLRSKLTPEQEILRNRLIMGSTSGFGCYFFAFDVVIFTAFFSYLTCNAALYIMQKRGVWRQEERWLAAICMDVTMAFTVMLREPEAMSLFYPIILWMILGNGFRYGVRWLYIASTLSAVSFGFVVVSTGYWQKNLTLGIALALALLVIPAYCSTLIRKISHAKEQAEIASRAKSYFLASVSHELRTPLNAIIGYGNHLRQVDMPRSQKEMIEASVLAGEHLLHLIEQLIEVAKSGTGNAQIKKAMFRPTELLTEIRSIMAVRAEEKHLSLQLQAEPLSDSMINGPSDVLRNILLNLTGNAIKFTDSGSVGIASGITERHGKHLVWFTVSDTGIGIAESSLQLIFKPFQQADDTVLNRFGGTGLGLAICKQLVEQVNGSITVSSSIGQGSTFRIEVPVDVAIEENLSFESVSADKIEILSFGDVAPDLLAGAQSLENIIVRHIGCRSPHEMEKALADIDLSRYHVAILAETLSRQIKPDSEIWQKFSDAEVAPVLVAGDQSVDVEDIALRAAFASILPPCPSFGELRSAIRIGCSFAHQLRLPHTDEVPAINIARPRKILVADDNRTNRNVLAAILEAAGHVVHMVTDGDEALEALEQSNFDILLLDINMPRLNGIDACAMWRQIEGGRQHLPIVGVTADATAETEQNCHNAGMDLRLTKPIDAKLLLATIERFCGDGHNAEDIEFTSSPDPLNVVVPFARGQHIDDNAIDSAQLDYLLLIGDAGFVLSMIEGFFEDIEQVYGPLRAAVEQADVRQFRFGAHAFKSSGNNMGAKQLAALCAKLERVTESEFAEHRYAYLEKIDHELKRATDALQMLSASHDLAHSITNRR